ncbi:UNVERIFIED_CONTAM: hypothetical protein FKN15_011675 [Acipenser sinensis]
MAAEMGLPQQVNFQAGGAMPTCTFIGLEGDCLELPPPPQEGDYLQLPPSTSEGHYLQLQPSPPKGNYLLLPPSTPEGHYLQFPPSPQEEGPGHDAGIP